MIRDASQIAVAGQATNSGRRSTPAEGASQIVAVGQATNSRGRSVAAKHQLRQMTNTDGRPAAATNQQEQATRRGAAGRCMEVPQFRMNPYNQGTIFSTCQTRLISYRPANKRISVNFTFVQIKHFDLIGNHKS